LDVGGGRGGEVPVGGEEEEEVVAGAVILAEFEDGLFAGYDVAAMAVEEENAFEAVMEVVFGEVAEEVEVEAGGGGDGAGVIGVVVGVAEPLEGREEGGVSDLGFRATEDFAEEKAIGIDREVMAVLFDSGDGDEDGGVFVEGLHRGPCHVGDVHFCFY